MPLERVLIVNDFAFINGGQSKVAIDSALLLADAGIEVIFFAAVGPKDSTLNHPMITTEIIGQHDILTDTSRVKAAGRGIWNSRAQKQLRALCGSLDPATTILHCHGYAKALSPSIGPILTNGPLRSVYTMHEYFLACPNGGFYDYRENKICTRKALGTSCLSTNCDVRHASHKAWRVVRQMATWGLGRIPSGLKDIIYISETQRRVMAPYLPKNARLHYVRNPTARPDAPPVRVADNDIFLFIGRLNPEKGGPMFAKAARMAGVRAVFVGDGVEADAVREANPDADILGWKSPAEVQEWIGRSRALVFPSLWSETFGLVAFEAMQRGVPVICGTWNAAAEVMEDGQNGILYDSPDVESLAAALIRIDEIGPLTGLTFLESVDPDKHVENLLGIYRTLLAELEVAK